MLEMTSSRRIGDDEGQQCFQQGDRRDGRRKELRCLGIDDERMVASDDDGRGRAVGDGDDREPLFARRLHGRDDIGPIGFAGHGNEHVPLIRPRQIVRCNRAHPRNRPDRVDRHISEIGEIACVGVVHADTKHVGVAGIHDCIGRRLHRVGIGRGERVLDVRDRASSHFRKQCAELPFLGQRLQPACPVWKVLYHGCGSLRGTD